MHDVDEVRNNLHFVCQQSIRLNHTPGFTEVDPDLHYSEVSQIFYTGLCGIC
jgi:hypothetical protein